MYEPRFGPYPNLAFLGPAFAAAFVSDMAAFAAKHFANLAAGLEEPAAREPQWSTPHSVALKLKTVWLRDFSNGATGLPILLCPPLALHGGAISDFAVGHSLVAAVQRAGRQRLFAADWRSATTDMRFLGIDDYLADLNVLVDDIGAPVDLIGMCQGGWMALVYAGRFPAKVRKLVLAGAPVDIAAAPSALSALAEGSPLPLFEELVRLGDGVVPGRKVMKFWGTASVATDDMRHILQTAERADSAAFKDLQARFRDWYGWTVDLPGRFFLQVVERLFKSNALAAGNFEALGRRIDLAAVTAPVFLLAAGDDELVAPAQLFAAERLLGTPARDLRKAAVPCRHVSLFIGKQILERTWPDIVHWLDEETHSIIGNASAPALAARMH